jgi:undecaprenyl-diphosphatase
MFGADAGAAFSAVVQLGPIVAIILYFRTDLIKYIQGMVRTKSPGKAITADDIDAKLGWFTLFGTAPLAIAGLLLEHKVDTTFRKPSIMGIALIVLALIMLAAERYGKRNRELSQITFGDSQKIGWAQALALVPGASRSGVTITTGMFLGLDRESAARFSFLLSIPAITAAGIYKLLKVMKHTGLGAEAGVFVLAAVVAGVVAFAVTKWFLGYMKHHNTNVFIAYRIVLGLLLLGLVATHKISNAPPAPEPEKAAAPAAQQADDVTTMHQSFKGTYIPPAHL